MKRRVLTVGGILASTMLILGVLAPSGATARSTRRVPLVRTILLSKLSPPSPDPAGITYDAGRDRLIVSDSEVDEMSIFAGVNLFVLTRRGQLSGTSSTTPRSKEPTGVAYGSGDRHLYYSDDNQKKIFDLRRGTDGKFGTKDDKVRRFSTAAFGNIDPEDLAISPRGVLFTIDGKKEEVYRISPGPNGRLDGRNPGSDDQVSHFDVGGFGAGDPEGLAFEPNAGSLLVIDRMSHKVYEISTRGHLLHTFYISQASARRPAGITVAPATGDPTQASLYIVDRGRDNNADPTENDGKLYEMTLGRPFSG